MGANCQCEGSKQDETTKFTPRPSSDVVNAVEEKAPMQAPAVTSLKAGLAPEIQKLQGSWSTEADGQLMGEITGGTIIWDQVFNQNQSTLRVAGPSAIEMELNGMIHKATYDESGRLTWSDGEVWVRK
eukprot:gb/GFBE01039990.1/.p1 GENE.gb/GFBE01039990.1/~~gb/GFBE01039990.1/.p1  ORF type:complete len:128 (+),score=26.59 gb/GFBE01039990.1/:1-384(+)